MSPPDQLGGLISGIGGSVRDIFARGAEKIIRTVTGKPDPKDLRTGYPFGEPLEKRVLWLLDRYYREGSFEKIQFARKWMRNALIFQGYHELEWSEVNVAWDVVVQDSGDYAFPNNYYRTLVLHGLRAYVQAETRLEPAPTNDDADSQAATKAAATALNVICKTVKYDYLRVIEGLHLRLFGNSFRYAYYSKDPRYGFVTQPVYQDADVLLSPGSSTCAICGPMEGIFDSCPACGSPIVEKGPPIVSKVPKAVGNVKYPRGEVMTEVVNPLEVYVRSSALDLWHAPFVIRNRLVDSLALQATYQKTDLSPKGTGGGEAYSAGDMALIYMQSLADLPGDPTQQAAWYERASSEAKSLLVEGWLRPNLYFFDKELIKACPDGLYGAKTGDTLLEARNDTIERHWTHFPFNPVPGRFWADGDDDIIPQQLKLDETDRLILRNQGYNSSPLLVIDSQRIDKNEIINDPSTIIEAKPAGRPVSDAVHNIQSQPLSQETWQWRSAHVSDMYTHSRVSPSAVGQHQPGVNTFGGQESMAAKSDSAILPNLILWKTADEMWATQALQLAAENWLDDRVSAVYGINGRWEFTKLRGSALALDKFKIESRVLPIDPQEQSSFTEAVTAGVLDPQDPRVKRKAMELWHLPRELDTFYADSKVQWEEIEDMKRAGKVVQPVLIRDNDDVHIEICREYMNSDECRTNPQLTQIILQHAQLHILNKAKMQMMIAAVQGAGQQVPGGAQNAQQPKEEQAQPQAGTNGGQVPLSARKRQQRAMQGAAAKPHRPQPSEGNQHHVQRLT